MVVEPPIVNASVTSAGIVLIASLNVPPLGVRPGRLSVAVAVRLPATPCGETRIWPAPSLTVTNAPSESVTWSTAILTTCSPAALRPCSSEKSAVSAWPAIVSLDVRARDAEWRLAGVRVDVDRQVRGELDGRDGEGDGAGERPVRGRCCRS